MKTITAFVLTILSMTILLAQLKSLGTYNVVWNGPSTDASGQMPLVAYR